MGEYLTDAKVGTWDLAWNYSQSMSLIGQFQPGDCIRFGTPGNGHSAIVVDVTKTGITLLEVNFVLKNTGKNSGFFEPTPMGANKFIDFDVFLLFSSICTDIFLFCISMNSKLII